MDVSRVARTVLLGTATAVVVALAGFAWCPTAVATPAFDETGLMKAGSAAEFDVLANDAAGPDWYAEPVDTSDSAVSGVGPTISVFLYDEPEFTGAKAIAYNVFDGDGALQHTSTLTVHVVPASLTAEGGDGQVILSGRDSPAPSTEPDQLRDGLRLRPQRRCGQDDGGRDRSGSLDHHRADQRHAVPLLRHSAHRRGQDARRFGRAEPASGRDERTAGGDRRHREPGGRRCASFDPAQNDTDIDDDPLEMVGHTDPAHGVLTCNSSVAATTRPVPARTTASPTPSPTATAAPTRAPSP